MSVISERDDRSRRYTSDTTDVEWQVVAAVLPWPAWLDGSGGRPEEYCRRPIVDAIFDRPGDPFLTLVPAEPFHRAPCPLSRRVVPRRGATCEGGWPWGRYARGHG
ncbi:hypothetical protein GCM10010317_090720 [Streptomyces mirabilis]|nr:hypothetical protein GCM10010317_090720 [Streptomyces mirabilis]